LRTVVNTVASGNTLRFCIYFLQTDSVEVTWRTHAALQPVAGYRQLD